MSSESRSALLPSGRLHRSSLCRLALLAAVIAFGTSGCAGLAVSLAGAGAGAGMSHQISGNATRTFTEPFDKVDNAVRVASKKMLLQIVEVASEDHGSVTTAKVGDLDVSLHIESLSATLTRVSVTARKDLFRVDGATAQEIVAQIDQALSGMTRAEIAPKAIASAPANNLSDTKFSENAAPRKPASNAKRKNSSI